MSLKDGSVPSIAITPDDDLISTDFEDNFDNAGAMIDTHTDVEDLETDFDDMSITKECQKLSMAPKTGNDGALTDIEDIETSGDEDEEIQADLSSSHFVAALEGVLDVEGTYEELFKYDSLSNSGKTIVSTGQPAFRGLGIPEDSRASGILTDVENFSDSEDESVVKNIIQEVDSEFLVEMFENMGTVDIADRVKKYNQPPSPTLTPIHGPSSVYGSSYPDCKESNFLDEAAGQSTPLHGCRSPTYHTSLSPIPPDVRRRLSDVTDTEILESDSDDEKTKVAILSRNRHYSSKGKSSLRPHSVGKGSTTDVEDIEFSDDEGFHIRRIEDPGYISSLLTNQVEPSKESIKMSYKPKQWNRTNVEGNLLGVPDDHNDSHTDVEDFEASGTEDENAIDEKMVSHLKEQSDEAVFSILEMESMYASVMESQTTLDTSGDQIVSLENPLTDTEELAISSPIRRKKDVGDRSSVSSECSTEEGSVQDSDTEARGEYRNQKDGRMQSQLPVTEVKFFDPADGRDPIPVIISPNASKDSKKFLPKSIKTSLYCPKPSDGGATDIEELLSSGDSDLEEEKRTSTKEDMSRKYMTNLNSDEDGVTDLEDFEADNLDEIDFSPKLPSALNPEDIPGFPPPVRELTLVKQDDQGHPTVLVLPLDEVKARGLFIPEDSGAAPTDVEDITDSEDEVEDQDLGLRVIDADGNKTLLVTPELPPMEGGIVESTDSMKVERKKLKLPSQAMADPTTDTEEMFLDASPTQRKRKVRSRTQISSTKRSPLTSSPNVVAVCTTDVEELEVSDLDSLPPGVHLSKNLEHLTQATPEAESTPYTSDAKTDIEDMEASDTEDHYAIQNERVTSITPDLMCAYGLETITEKQGDGPFTEDVRQRILVHHTQMRSFDSKEYSQKRESLGSVPAIRMTSPSPDIPTTTDTEDIFASADEGRESPAPLPADISLELEEHCSVIHVKHTRKIDVEAPEEAMHIKGHRGLDVLTDVEDLGLSEEENQNHSGGINVDYAVEDFKDFSNLSESVLSQISVYDGENKVCICLGSKNEEDSVANRSTACVCVGKSEGDITITSESLVNLETVSGAAMSAGPRPKEGSERAAAVGPTEEWTERMQQKQTAGREGIAPEDTGSEFYQMQDPEGLASSEYDPSQTTTQSRVVTTRTHTRTIVGEDGRPVTVTTTETDVGSDNDAEGILGSNQLRESMQQIIDQFGVAEDTKEGRGKKEEKPE